MSRRIQKKKFQQQAQRQRSGLFKEFFEFLIHNKKWWLLPIFLILLLISLFIMLSGTAIAPFIYPLF